MPGRETSALMHSVAATSSNRRSDMCDQSKGLTKGRARNAHLESNRVADHPEPFISVGHIILSTDGHAYHDDGSKKVKIYPTKKFGVSWGLED